MIQMETYQLEDGERDTIHIPNQSQFYPRLGLVDLQPKSTETRL